MRCISNIVCCNVSSLSVMRAGHHVDTSVWITQPNDHQGIRLLPGGAGWPKCKYSDQAIMEGLGLVPGWDTHTDLDLVKIVLKV